MYVNHLTWWNVLFTNLWIKDVFPVRESPTTTTVHFTSLAIFIFVILYCPHTRIHYEASSSMNCFINMSKKFPPTTKSRVVATHSTRECMHAHKFFWCRGKFFMPSHIFHKIERMYRLNLPLTSRNHFSWRTNLPLTWD